MLSLFPSVQGTLCAPKTVLNSIHNFSEETIKTPLFNAFPTGTTFPVQMGKDLDQSKSKGLKHYEKVLIPQIETFYRGDFQKATATSSTIQFASLP